MSGPFSKLTRRRRTVGAFLALAASLASIEGVAQNRRSDYELPPINYSSRKPDDAVARLLERIAASQAGFGGSDLHILREVLRELQVPVESQIVVFSRTSMQGGLINARNPRALYFSDSVYVGWVPGGLIEVAAVDAELGPIYYGFDPQDARDARRTFVRETSCLRCHGGSTGRDIPALFARSVIANERGLLVGGREFGLMDDTMPFEQRWGGWYVTGYSGSVPHRGNAFGREREGGVEFVPSEWRPAELSEYFDPSGYLADTSDIGALLVFQHQLTMHNVLTRASHRSHRALAETLAEDERQSVLQSVAEEVVDHLLFRDSAPLPAGVVVGDAFRRAFMEDARRTAAGASLKDFAGGGRLFAQRCSFLIHSDSFAALPGALKEIVFGRLHTALTESGPAERYAYLEPDERGRILAILGETHPEAREAFRRHGR